MIARLLPLLVVVLTSMVELVFADRKFGVFTGGFGQSQAVDTPVEIFWFVAGYTLAQAFSALVVWQFSGLLHRRQSGWPRIFQFCVIFVGGNLALLIASYQLHSYFSDAVSFTLIKQLGGGSLLDALLFGLHEILSGFAILIAGLLLWGIAWWWMSRRYGIVLRKSPRRLRWRALAGLFLGLVITIPIVGRTAPDASFGLDRTLAWGGIRQVLDIATDFDRDGYGLFGRNIDDHPFDGSRHPLALDIPGDGIDQDGYGGDLKLVPVPVARASTHVPAHGPNVIVVVMESTRADTIGKRIDGRPVAPNLEALAREGTAIVPSFSHVAFTTASLKSLFSGSLSPSMGAPSLFRDLKQSGYRVGVYSGQAEDFGDISATVGMKSSADHFIDAETLKNARAFGFAAQGSLLIDENIVLDRFAADYARPHAWDRPNFLYFNFQSPHFPYDHPGVPRLFVHQPIPRDNVNETNKDWVQRTYWNAVAHADASLGRLIALLKRTGQWNNTILLVTGDHGESLFEDGFLGHGHIINARQYATFMVVNRKVRTIQPPIAISDYRGIVLDLLSGTQPRSGPRIAPFLHIGPLDAPTQIGLVLPGGIATLRLDTGIACIATDRCDRYENLSDGHRKTIDALVARWGSERWASRTRH